jgi:uncharacterized membrane protein
MIIWAILCCVSSKQTQDTSSENCSLTPTYEEWAYGFFRGKCQSCHASNTTERYGAPEHITFDNYEQIQIWIEAIEQTVLINQTMPPSGGITDEETILLQQWLSCPY